MSTVIGVSALSTLIVRKSVPQYTFEVVSPLSLVELNWRGSVTIVTVLSPSSPKSKALDSPVIFAGVESIRVFKSSSL